MEILPIFKHALMITVFVFVMMLLVDFIYTACALLGRADESAAEQIQETHIAHET